MELDKRVEKLPWINIVLLMATFLTTSVAGGLQVGVDPFKDGFWLALVRGIPFSISIMFVLGIHELGHYFAARKFDVDVTLPYFIPAPTFLGTFGAFIKMRSPVRTRRELATVAIMGPLAGFVAAIVVTLVGLHYSEIREVTAHQENVIQLGDPLIMKILYRLYFGPDIGGEVYLHPVAFAGWIGFFVTSLNLIPASQLDGGHIFYTLFERWHTLVTVVISFSLLILGVFTWGGWIVWGFLILLIGRRHPHVIYRDFPPDTVTKLIFVLGVLLFLLTFIPVPFKIY